MPLGRSNSLHHSKKQMPQITGTKQTERLPLATSPIVNSLRNSESVQNLSLTDCSCPICLEILIEPVVLPCKHELCLPCFKDMMEQTNFLCPMCRMRLSTWARSASKHNSLVDKQRWLQIQKQFSNEIKLRLEGKTAQILSEEIKKQKENQQITKSASSQHISAQGEIKKEYEEYLRREEERIRLEKEKEESLSIKYIQEILQREEACTLNDYLRVIQTKTPSLVQNQPQQQTTNENLPTTSNSNNQATNNTVTNQPTTSTASNQTQHQPFITPSIPPVLATNNRLLNRVKSSLGVQTPNPTDSTDLSNITPSYSLRPRASIKRNIEDVRSIRSNLISSLNRENENNQNSVNDDQPKSKRVSRSKSVRNVSTNSSSESISLNESLISIDTSHESNQIDIDSKQTPSLKATNLNRRKSTRKARMNK